MVADIATVVSFVTLVLMKVVLLPVSPEILTLPIIQPCLYMVLACRQTPKSCVAG